MPTKKTGTEAQLYRNTGSWASPTWAALAVRDLKFSDMPSGTFDSSDRTIDFDTVIPTRTKFKVEFEFHHDAANTGLVALITAASSGRATPIELLATDGPVATSGTKGIRFEAAITSGQENDAKLTDGQIIKMTAQPHGNYTNAPVRWTT